MLSGLNAMGTVHQLILHRGIEGARKEASSDKTDRLCVEAAYEVMADEDGRIGIAHAGFAMTALPHKRITETVWERDGGQIKLLVESGLDIRKQPIGVPYGSIAGELWRVALLPPGRAAVCSRPALSSPWFGGGAENRSRTRNQEILPSLPAPALAPDHPIELALRQLGASIDRRLLMNKGNGQASAI